MYLNAADWGWVQRPRLYWGLDVEKLQSRPGVEVARPGSAAVDLTVIRYTGSPVPRTWSPGCGGEWSYRGETGVRSLVPPGSGYSCSYPEGQFMTFTTCFPHPADRPPRNASSDPHVFRRFQADGRMHPSIRTLEATVSTILHPASSGNSQPRTVRPLWASRRGTRVHWLAGGPPPETPLASFAGAPPLATVFIFRALHCYMLS